MYLLLLYNFDRYSVFFGLLGEPLFKPIQGLQRGRATAYFLVTASNIIQSPIVHRIFAIGSLVNVSTFILSLRLTYGTGQRKILSKSVD